MFKPLSYLVSWKVDLSGLLNVFLGDTISWIVVVIILLVRSLFQCQE